MAPRVLFVDYSVGFGGASRSISLLLKGLPPSSATLVSSQVRAVRTWYPRGISTYRFRRLLNYQRLEHARWVINHYWPWLLRWPALKAIATIDAVSALVGVPRFVWILKRHRIQIVHCNNGFTPFEAFAAARLLRVPCIVHLRGIPEPESGTGRWMMRQTRAAIAISQAVKDALPQGSPPAFVVHNPVDATELVAPPGARATLRAQWGIADTDIAAGILGRVVDWKGHREFALAIIEAVKRNPRVRGVIVGNESDEEPEYFRAVQDLIARSGVADRFVLAGYHERINECYAALDIVVHASITPEPFGRTVIEGMAARRPVIASAAGGPLEIITPGKDGLLVPPGDVHQLANAIVRLAGDQPLREQLAAAGYDTVTRRFTPEIAAAEVRDVYRRVLS